MSKDVYGLAALSLCFIATSALEVRERCEGLRLSNKDRIGILKAIDMLHKECSEMMEEIERDSLGVPTDKTTFDALTFKINCLASAKSALKSRN